MKPFVTCYRGVAHPWLCDRLEHLNTRFYFAALDDAMQSFFGLLGYYPDERHGWADVRHDISYKCEIPQGSQFKVNCALVRIGSKSIQYRQEVIISDTGVVAASCNSTTVLLDLSTRKAAPVPTVVLENAAPYLLKDQVTA